MERRLNETRKVFLNYDVTHTVMLFMSRGDLPSIMQTCHSLYKLGVPLLVRHSGDIRFHNIDVIESFCKFMLVDYRSRLPSFRRFHLWLRYDEDDASQVLQYSRVLNDVATILHHASHLQFLYLCHAESILKLSSRLAAAVGQLPDIREVDFLRVGTKSAFVLMQLRSPLTRVTLNFPQSDLPNPIHILSNSSTTMEMLKIAPMSTNISPAPIVYPRIHTLSITIHEMCDWTLNAQPLFYSFPNLRKLILSLPFDMTRGDEPAPVTEYWRHLDVLKISLAYASYLTLITQVDYLYFCISGTDTDVIESDESEFRRVMSRLQPVHLDTTMELICLFSWNDLGTILPSRMEHLFIVFCIFPGDVQDYSQLREKVLAFLSGVPLKSLKVHFAPNVMGDNIDDFPETHPKSLATFIAAAIPSLHLINIRLDDSITYWKVKPKANKSRPSLRELDEGEGYGMFTEIWPPDYH